MQTVRTRISRIFALLSPGVVWTQEKRAIPPEWDPVRPYTAFFAFHFGELVLIPVRRVEEINGIRLPHGPMGEFPTGRYVLADLVGRTEFIGYWPAPLRGEVTAEIARRRAEACKHFAPYPAERATVQ